MALKDRDMKRLWARSGNMCSFPGCEVVLVPEKEGNKVIGDEAHIKGENPTSPRYDRDQSDEARNAHSNRILLCPTHARVIDSDEETYTVELLHKLKAAHERQMQANQIHPQLVGELLNLVEKYKPPNEDDSIAIAEILEKGARKVFRVDASQEGGIGTNIKIMPGQRIHLFARGLISYDGGYHFTTPEGIICNERGFPFLAKDSEGNQTYAVWPHKDAYETDGKNPGIIGSLYGWIGKYAPDRAFLVGSKREVEVLAEGILHLAVNDARGTYGDNDGEFRVEIMIVEAKVGEIQDDNSETRRSGTIETSRAIEPNTSFDQNQITIKHTIGPQGPVSGEK